MLKNLSLYVYVSSKTIFSSFYLAFLLAFPSIVKAETETLSPDIPDEIIKESPVLQKWLQETPNILEEIRNDPSFRTRLNIGFSIFPDNDDITGITVAVEDVFIGRTGLTLSADYQTSWNGDRTALGTDLHYFLFPLGGYVNIAPLLGYRYVKSNDFDTDGVNLGLRLMLALSRTGAADISLTQSFVSPGSTQEVGLFSIAVGYSITSDIRLSTSWKLQNSPQNKDDSFSIGMQYLF